MKKLKKILLINWLYFSKEIIEVGDVNFLTGKNGAGKSTVIDALQIVLLGETNARNFNQAANEKSQRTLDGYLRADMDENNPYSRRGKDFSSYIACEFQDDVAGSSLSRVSFLIAAVMEAGRIAFSFMWERCLRIVLLKTEKLWRFLRCAGF
ncbi:MAG: ATP-binding protein [Vescimonas sp.]